MSATFYIASSSEVKYREKVKALAAEFIKMGMVWEFDWDSTFVAGSIKPSVPTHKFGYYAQKDILAAINCDVFVEYLADPWSRGAHIELGARLGAGKQVLLVADNLPSDYFFYQHALVTRFNTEEELLFHLRKETENVCLLTTSRTELNQDPKH